jgi:ABC-type sugar transport system ATPase subunit
MIGREDRTMVSRHRDPGGRSKLEARGVATAFGHRDISLQLRRGEILGLYGLVGAGRSELARALVGKDRSPPASSASTASRCASARSHAGAPAAPDRLCQRGPEVRGR